MTKREIKPRVFSSRDWQKQAYKKVIQAYNLNEKNFLTVATPGAGKTKYALMVCHEFLLKGYVQRIVVVTPTENLKTQWAKDAAEFAGIDLDPEVTTNRINETPEFHGAVLTYALLGIDKGKTIKSLVDRIDTLVIFDEVHHLGDNLTWGDASSTAFENAKFRLLISGTAFRSDTNKIPYVNYEGDVSKANYTYSYEQAILDNVCRPIYFHSIDGIMKWEVGEYTFLHKFSDSVAKDQKSKRLKTALDSQGQFIRDVFLQADQTLTQVRKTHPQAAGLIFCTTQEHAKDISKVVKKLTGTTPLTVISEDSSSNGKINQFKNSNEKWIITVKMVSEGVDIPRLRVGVYLTNVKAELFFRQAIGRFVRVLQGLEQQDAHIFIPADKDIVTIAETIQEERDHALYEIEEEKKAEKGLFPDYTPALKGDFIPLGSKATTAKTISVNVGISNGMITKKIIRQNLPIFEQKIQLRERLNDLAKDIAKKNSKGNKDIDWQFAHRLWIANGGKNMENESLEELQNRMIYYNKLYKG